MFGAHINWLRKPLPDDLPFLQTALQGTLACYEHTYASFISCHIPFTQYLIGESLLTVQQELRKARQIFPLHPSELTLFPSSASCSRILSALPTS